MSGIRQFLLSKREQVSSRLPSLEAKRDEYRSAWMKASDQLAEAQEELRKIDLVLKTLEYEEAKSAQPTIMQAVLEVLKQKPEGMTALEILAEINARYFDGRIVRTSLSPQLSRLKDRDNKIILRGNRWHLVDQDEPTLFTQKS